MSRVACFLALLGVVAGASKTTEPETPVEKVVNLLKELKGRISMDMKQEQKIYDKFACWCEIELKKKAGAIWLEGVDTRKHGQKILTLKGQIATLTAEIEELVSNIKSELEAIAELTGIRQKENAEYQADSTEMSQAIAAMEKAITVLFEATKLLQEGSASGATAQEAAAGVRSAIAAMPASAALSPESAAKVTEFLEGASRATSKAAYAPQSATIQGILKDMYDTFAMDLESATQQEATRNRLFEETVAKKMALILEYKATLEKKEADKAEAEQALAETQQLYDENDKQMNHDIEYFDATKQPRCEAKFAEWTQRKAERTEELEGIDEALKILTSDESRALFHKSIKPGMEPSFLQIDAAGSEGNNAMKAFRALKAQAARTHSLRLAALAATVRTAKAGHFDKVIAAIDEMIGVLKDEETADIAKRDQCKEEYTKTASVIADHEWKIEKNLAKINKLEGLIKMREDEKVKTLEDIDDVKQNIAAMEEQRQVENSMFIEAKSDDQDAIALLEKAKAALMSYYKNNKIELGPIQGSVKLLQQPEFQVSDEQAPDATFAHKGSRKNESKGIISILTMIIEDLGGEIRTGMKEEEAAQLLFEKNLAIAKKLQADLEKKVEDLDEMIATRNKELDEEHADKKANTQVLDEEVAYRKSITADCDWILNSFEERREKRAMEMDGLVTAKEFLVGAAPPSMLQAQKPVVRPFNDAAFPKIGFQGLSFLQRRQ